MRDNAHMPAVLKSGCHKTFGWIRNIREIFVHRQYASSREIAQIARSIKEKSAINVGGAAIDHLAILFRAHGRGSDPIIPCSTF